MTRVKELLQSKPLGVLTIEPTETVYRALEIMAENNVGALVVVDGDQTVGMFSERDYARKVVLKGRSSKDTPVGDLMTRNLYTVDPETTVEECMSLLTDKRIRHLPVIEEGRLVGIVSIGDLVKRIIAEQEMTIQQLEDYIVGRR